MNRKQSLTDLVVKKHLWNPNKCCMWGSLGSRRKTSFPVWKEPSPMMTRCIQLRIAMATGRERPRSLSWPGAGESLFALSMKVSFQSGLPWPVLWCNETVLSTQKSQQHVTGYQWLTWHFDFLFAITGANKNLEGRWFKNPHYLVRVLSNISVMCTRYFATVLSFGVGVLNFLCSGWFGMLWIFLNILWACSLDSACSRTMNMK